MDRRLRNLDERLKVIESDREGELPLLRRQIRKNNARLNKLHGICGISPDAEGCDESSNQQGGGAFEMLSGFERIRGQRYDKWLEQRLVLVHNDTEFVNKVRKRFGYDKTNIVGRGQLTKKMVEDELCARSEEERQLIDPSLKCDHRGGKRRKTRKRRKRLVRKKKRSTRKH